MPLGLIPSHAGIPLLRLVILWIQLSILYDWFEQGADTVEFWAGLKTRIHIVNTDTDAVIKVMTGALIYIHSF